MQSTFETKLKLTAQESDILLEQAKQMCRIERQLFVRLYVKKEEVNQVKRDTLAYDQITGRQYNSVLYSLKGRIGNIEENHKFQIQQLSGQVKAVGQKIKTIKEEINKTESAEKKKQKLFVLHQKKRKRANLEARLSSIKEKLDRLVPDVCFGSRKLFNAQHYLEANGYKTHAEWKQDWDFARHNQFALIGSKDETAGNQSAQLNLEAKTLKLRLTDSLASKYDQKILVLTNIAFPYGQDKIEKALENKQALFHRFVARKEDNENVIWFLKTSIEEPEAEIVTDSANGIIGLDLNADHIALGYVSGDGNPLGESKIHFDVNNKTSGQIEALFGDAVKQIVDEAVDRKAPIAIENLDFSKKKTELGERGKQYARLLSGFAYALFFTLLMRRAAKDGVQIKRRNPAYTSIIGAVKFSAGYGISTDGGAAIAIGRRGLNFSESLSTRAKSPSLNRILIEANTEGKEKHVWSRWSKVKKRLGHNRKLWPGRCSEKQLEASLNKNVRSARSRRLSENVSRTIAASA